MSCCDYGTCAGADNCPVRPAPCPAQAFYAQHKPFFSKLAPLPAPVDESAVPLPKLQDPTLRPFLLGVFTLGMAFGGTAVQLWGAA